MTRTIVIQPAMLPDLTLPYPWIINGSSFLVGRQDFWKGKPRRLVGFTVTGRTYEILLRPEEWVDDIGQAIGMVPVFEHADGGYVTWEKSVIDHARVLDIKGGGRS